MRFFAHTHKPIARWLRMTAASGQKHYNGLPLDFHSPRIATPDCVGIACLPQVGNDGGVVMYNPSPNDFPITYLFCSLSLLVCHSFSEGIGRGQFNLANRKKVDG